MLICCTKRTGCEQGCASTEQCCVHMCLVVMESVVSAAVHAVHAVYIRVFIQAHEHACSSSQLVLPTTQVACAD
jgi:hypothetical protein